MPARMCHGCAANAPVIKPEARMPRPRCCRRIAGSPCARVFKPVGAPVPVLPQADGPLADRPLADRPLADRPGDAEEVALSLEEFEAIRLADHEGLYQEQAAALMEVSRQTFGRTIAQARAKVARALVLGLCLRIGPASTPQAPCDFCCAACGTCWQASHGRGRPKGCPACGANDFKRIGCGGKGSGCDADPHHE